MPKNTSITLGDHFATFIEAQLSEGRYGNASEVIRAGLRLLEEREAKLNALRRASHEGVESGAAEPFDVDTFIKGKTRVSKRA